MAVDEKRIQIQEEEGDKPCHLVSTARLQTKPEHDDKHVLDGPNRLFEALRRLLYGSQHEIGTPGDLTKGQTKAGDIIKLVFQNVEDGHFPPTWLTYPMKHGKGGKKESTAAALITAMLTHRRG